MKLLDRIEMNHLYIMQEKLIISDWVTYVCSITKFTCGSPPTLSPKAKLQVYTKGSLPVFVAAAAAVAAIIPVE